MKAFTLRMEDWQHKILLEAAQKESRSLNNYCLRRLLGDEPTSPVIKTEESSDVKCEICGGSSNPDNLDPSIRYDHDFSTGESHPVCAGCYKKKFGKIYKNIFIKLNPKPI